MTPDAIVSVTPSLMLHVSCEAIVWFVVMVASLVKIIEAASARGRGKNGNRVKTKNALATIITTDFLEDVNIR